MGEVLGIAMREKPRLPMVELAETEISVEAGLAGDFRGTSPGRQVTVLTEEGWHAACDAVGEALPWTTRRANLLVRGVDLKGRVGARIRVGEAVLVITDECEPCHIMEGARGGLRQALTPDWRGGATCRVETGGMVKLGDGIILV